MTVVFLAGILAILLIFSAMISMRPDVFLVKRSLALRARDDVIFDQINDLRKWENWSPWAKLDPATRRHFEGPREGVGAVLRWDGDEKTGKGSMIVTQSRPSNLIRILLEFEKPIRSTSTAEFVLVPLGDQTVLTWSMYGNLDFKSKAMGIFTNAEEFLGRRMERGLVDLRHIVESEQIAQ
ncbi:MAG: SRPBCC family protein [Alphaproteobacteria bacterium]|nr:SRPBCC family protein [Alphaproteobacteria bacterium]